jgi:plasmid stabilization system protein ParE
MVEVGWTLQASQDLDAIVGFVAKDSPQYARHLIYRLKAERIELLAIHHGARLLDPAKLK